MGMSSEIRERATDSRGAAGIPEPMAGAARAGADRAAEGGDDSAVALVTALDSLAAQMRAVAWMLRDDARRLDHLPDGAHGAWERYRHADELMGAARKVDKWAAGISAEQAGSRGDEGASQ